jgi:hypothetical protein
VIAASRVVQRLGEMAGLDGALHGSWPGGIHQNTPETEITADCKVAYSFCGLAGVV